jgi:hypothetical protein
VNSIRHTGLGFRVYGLGHREFYPSYAGWGVSGIGYTIGDPFLRYLAPLADSHPFNCRAKRLNLERSAITMRGDGGEFVRVVCAHVLRVRARSSCTRSSCQFVHTCFFPGRAQAALLPWSGALLDRCNGRQARTCAHACRRCARMTVR